MSQWFRKIEERVSPWKFDRIYGAFWNRVIETDGKRVVAQSVARHIELLSREPD